MRKNGQRGPGRRTSRPQFCANTAVNQKTGAPFGQKQPEGAPVLRAVPSENKVAARAFRALHFLISPPFCTLFFEKLLNSVYTRSGQNSTPNSNATNLHSSQKRCCSFCISSSNASPTFQVQKSIFHQMTKPIQVTVILPLLLAISFSRNDDIHSSISGISNDLIGVISTIGQ